jgi:hypothetical protein
LLLRLLPSAVVHIAPIRQAFVKVNLAGLRRSFFAPNGGVANHAWRECFAGQQITFLCDLDTHR